MKVNFEKMSFPDVANHVIKKMWVNKLLL